MNVLSCASVIQLLNRVCGPEASVRLVETFGGQEISIPKAVGGKLVETLGEDVATALIREHGGCRVNVPSRGHAMRMISAQNLRDDVVNTDLSANELAEKHGVTAVYVRQLRARLRPTSSNPCAKA